jgi:polyphosphate glucokinase
MIILVIDIGGTSIKMGMSGREDRLKIPSGPALTAEKMVVAVTRATERWTYEAISIGYPGPVVHGKPVEEPKNLASGWVGFEYEKAFDKPLRMVNDAAMQALGGYQGGRMLFLGLGTGLGSALVVEGVLQPLELAHLPYRRDRTYEDYLGRRGYDRLGRKKWQRHVEKVVKLLKHGLQADYVVLGGGQAKLLNSLPPGTHLGTNANAIVGGLRLWSQPVWQGDEHERKDAAVRPDGE